MGGGLALVPGPPPKLELPWAGLTHAAGRGLAVRGARDPQCAAWGGSVRETKQSDALLPPAHCPPTHLTHPAAYLQLWPQLLCPWPAATARTTESPESEPLQKVSSGAGDRQSWYWGQWEVGQVADRRGGGGSPAAGTGGGKGQGSGPSPFITGFPTTFVSCWGIWGEQI